MYCFFLEYAKKVVSLQQISTQIMNFEGIILGLATFLLIGIFHPIVIKSECYFIELDFQVQPYEITTRCKGSVDITCILIHTFIQIFLVLV